MTTAYAITANVVEKRDAGFTCDCAARLKAAFQVIVTTSTQPPIVLGEKYLCEECIKAIHKSKKDDKRIAR
jgi:hypothetical protein